MNELWKQFKKEHDINVLDHNGNYDYRYVAWLEEKLWEAIAPKENK